MVGLNVTWAQRATPYGYALVQNEPGLISAPEKKTESNTQQGLAERSIKIIVTIGGWATGQRQQRQQGLGLCIRV